MENTKTTSEKRFLNSKYYFFKNERFNQYHKSTDSMHFFKNSIQDLAIFNGRREKKMIF